MLEIKNLSYDVAENGRSAKILRNVSLTINDNRFIVITGPNGGGKTSLARSIMGLTKVTAGRIIWDGRDITDLSVTERARLRISYGFQQPPRFKGMCVQDLLELASGNKHLTREECCRYLTKVGLCSADYVDREVDNALSGGEIKRIEIATILARRSGLMIFDEPEAGIDLWSFARLTETFQTLHEQGGVTLIIISHQERIINLADELVLMTDGQVVRHGPRESVFPYILADTVSGCTYMEKAVAQ